MSLPRPLHLLLAGLVCAGPVLASPDKDFLAAREAQAKGQVAQFERLAGRVPASHPLRVYLDYWRLKLREPPAHELLAFADAHPDTPLSERLRQDVARQYGADSDWPAFRRVVGRLARQDREMQCYALHARLDQEDPGVATEALALWHTGQDLPDACTPLFARLAEHGVLATRHRIARLRLVLEAGDTRLAQALIAGLPDGERPAPAMLEQAQRTPERLVEADLVSTAGREIQLHALGQLAKADPERAARLWQARASDLPEAHWRHGWGVVALAAARQHRAEAEDWFARGGDLLSDLQRLWRVRAALRSGHWQAVYHGIAALPAETQGEAVWRYWKARALRELQANAQANLLFAQLSREIHYYGLLAYEELPLRLEARPDDYRPGPAQIRAVKARPGIARALLLHRLDLQTDAVSEWEWAVRGMDDHDLLAAAEVARNAQWYDRAIITAEKTRAVHSFDLRYLTPYRDLAVAQARQNDLDPAWVYGLMRQESRFVDYARSWAGAQGLMQIMPATAKWIARQLRLDRKAHARMHDPEANIRFGTYYLRYLLDRLHGSPVLATAGYNAGPGRARRWQADHDLEGAIYTETIPVVETREYVKKVLANAMYYNRRLGLQAGSFKERLGSVPARIVESAPEP